MRFPFALALPLLFGQPALSAPPVPFAATVPATAAVAAGWLLSLDEAMAQAKATGRPVLIVFAGTDWCKPCIQLQQEVFETPEFGTYAAGHLVLLREDFPRQKKNLLSPAQTKANDAVAARFNREGEFPLAVLIDADGKVLGRSIGYRPGGAAAYIAHLQELVPALGK